MLIISLIAPGRQRCLVCFYRPVESVIVTTLLFIAGDNGSGGKLNPSVSTGLIVTGDNPARSEPRSLAIGDSIIESFLEKARIAQ